MDVLVLILIALVIAFALYMADVLIQIRADLQVVRKKVNVLTASPNPPAAPSSPSSLEKKKNGNKGDESKNTKSK